MRRNPAYFRTRTHGDSESIDGEDVEKRNRTQIHEDMVTSVVEGVWSKSGNERTEDLSLDLSGLTKSEKERSAERRRHERGELAELLAEKLVEKSRAAEREQDTVSKGDDWNDPAEACQKASDLLGELIERTS